MAPATINSKTYIMEAFPSPFIAAIQIDFWIMEIVIGEFKMKSKAGAIAINETIIVYEEGNPKIVKDRVVNSITRRTSSSTSAQ